MQSLVDVDTEAPVVAEAGFQIQNRKGTQLPRVASVLAPNKPPLCHCTLHFSVAQGRRRTMSALLKERSRAPLNHFPQSRFWREFVRISFHAPLRSLRRLRTTIKSILCCPKCQPNTTPCTAKSFSDRTASLLGPQHYPFSSPSKYKAEGATATGLRPSHSKHRRHDAPTSLRMVSARTTSPATSRCS